MITFTRSLGGDVLDIVLDLDFGKETLNFNGRPVSEVRAIRSSIHRFEVADGSSAGRYTVQLSTNLISGAFTCVISRDDSVIDQFTEYPFQLSTPQKLIFISLAAALPLIWLMVWQAARLPMGAPMFFSVLIPFGAAMASVRMMMVRNMKAKGSWRRKANKES